MNNDWFWPALFFLLVLSKDPRNSTSNNCHFLAFDFSSASGTHKSFQMYFVLQGEKSAFPSWESFPK